MTREKENDRSLARRRGERLLISRLLKQSRILRDLATARGDSRLESTRSDDVVKRLRDGVNFETARFLRSILFVPVKSNRELSCSNEMRIRAEKIVRVSRLLSLLRMKIFAGKGSRGVRMTDRDRSENVR